MLNISCELHLSSTAQLKGLENKHINLIISVFTQLTVIASMIYILLISEKTTLSNKKYLSIKQIKISGLFPM